MSELPENWEWSTIGQIGTVASGGTPSTERSDYYDGEIPWITPKDLSGYTEKFISGGYRSISKEGLANSSAKILPKGTVLFSSRAPIGYCVIATNALATNQGFKNLIPDDRVLADYVYHYLKGNKQLAEKHASGTTFLELSGKAFSKLPIPLPPLPEQRRIVARIEELFSRLDAGVAALRHAKAQLQRYRQSVLAAAVTGQLTQAWREQHPDTEPAEELLGRIYNARAAFFKSESKNSEVKRHVSKHKLHKFTEPKNWSIPTTWKFASLLSSCQFVVDCHNKTPPYEDSGIPLIRTTNVRCGKLAWPKMKFVSERTAAHWSQRCTPKAGDILFTREAPAGEAAIVPENTRLCMGQRMMLFRSFHDLLLPAYLLTVIQSHNFQAQYGDKQVGVGVQHLRVGDVESLVLPTPPLAEQHQIVAEVEARTSAIDHLEAELDRQITRSNRLRQSTLASAFSGNL